MSDSAILPAIRVAIVLVNWNGWRDCIECIDSLLAQAHRNFHIFVVDNDSHDGSVEHIAAWCASPEADAAWRRHAGVERHTDQAAHPGVPIRVKDPGDSHLPPGEGCLLTLIRSGGNLGFAGGCNMGVRVAGVDEFAYFWFLNPDTVVEREALVELIRRAECQPRMGMVGSTLRYYDAPETVQALGGARLNPLNAFSWHIGEGSALSDVPKDGSAVELELAYVVGASMLVSAKVTAASDANAIPCACRASWNPISPSPTGRCCRFDRRASGMV